MLACKIHDEPQAIRPFQGLIDVQPAYHSEISEAYIAAMQADVDSKKPAGFTLTPLTPAGW